MFNTQDFDGISIITFKSLNTLNAGDDCEKELIVGLRAGLLDIKGLFLIAAGLRVGVPGTKGNQYNPRTRLAGGE